MMANLRLTCKKAYHTAPHASNRAARGSYAGHKHSTSQKNAQNYGYAHHFRKVFLETLVIKPTQSRPPFPPARKSQNFVVFHCLLLPVHECGLFWSPLRYLSSLKHNERAHEQQNFTFPSKLNEKMNEKICRFPSFRTESVTVCYRPWTNSSWRTQPSRRKFSGAFSIRYKSSASKRNRDVCGDKLDLSRIFRVPESLKMSTHNL